MISFVHFARFWSVINLMSAGYQLFNPRVRAYNYIELGLILLTLFLPRKKIWTVSALSSVLIFYFFRLPYVSMSESTMFLLNIHWLMLNALSKENNFKPGAYYLIPGMIFLVSAIHKLNDSFFDKAHSCVSYFYPWLSQSFLPWLLIPTLVLISYLVVGLGQFTKFRQRSWIMMFLIQVPLCFFGVWEFSIATWSGVITATLREMSPKRLAWMIFWLIIYTFVVLILKGDLRIYLASVCTLALLFPFLVETQLPWNETRPLKKEYSLIAAMFIWCLSPYWGGDQLNVFSMFSNLQLSPYYSNSWLPNLGKDISPDEWVEVREMPLIDSKVYIPVSTKIDLENWDRTTPIYFPKRYLYFFMQDGVKIKFTHQGKEWSWPGDAGEWRKMGHLALPEKRKAISNGHCQI